MEDNEKIEKLEKLMARAERIKDQKFIDTLKKVKKIDTKEVVKSIKSDLVEAFNFYKLNPEKDVTSFINALWEYEDDGITINVAGIYDQNGECIGEIDVSAVMGIWNDFALDKLNKKQLDENFYVLKDICIIKVYEIAAKAGVEAMKMNEFRIIKEKVPAYEYFGGVQKSFAIDIGDEENEEGEVILTWEENIHSDIELVEEDAADILQEGIEFYENGEIDKAIECFEDSIAIFEERIENAEDFDDYETYTGALMNLGNCYAYDKGDTSEAIKVYEKAIKYGDRLYSTGELKDIFMLVSILLDLGTEYMKNSEIQKAGYYFARGEKTLKELGINDEKTKNTLLLLLLNSGDVYTKLGRTEDAAAKFREGEILCGEDDKEINSEFLLRHANILFKSGRIDDALEDYLGAKAYLETLGIKEESYGEVSYNLAAVYARKEMKKEMIENMENAVKVNPAYKQNGLKDKDFEKYWSDELFKKI